jgi:hypothetical protein
VGQGQAKQALFRVAREGRSAAYRDRTGWGPGSDGGEQAYIFLRPTTIQVWRDVDEIAWRTVIRLVPHR